jgi:uncharacterized membrane protein
MHAELLVLRFVHVVGAVFWVGTGLFTSLFLVPAIVPLGPTAGQVMGALAQRKLYTILPIVAMLTMLSGVRLMLIASAGSSAYFASTPGRVYSAAALTSVIGFLLSTFVTRPVAMRGVQLGAQMAQAADDATRQRIAVGDAWRGGVGADDLYGGGDGGGAVPLARRLGEVADSVETGEVAVQGPERRPVSHCRRVDDAIRQGQFVR